MTQKQNKKQRKIVLCGHYGSTNLGDEAIGLGIIHSLKGMAADADITVLSYDPVRSDRFYKKMGEHNVKCRYLLPFGLRSFVRGIVKGELFKTLQTIKRCDVFILGGGGLFTNESLFAVFLWGLHAFMAYVYKKSVIMLGQSVDHLKSGLARWITFKAFNKANVIIVRDSESKKALNALKIKKEIEVSTDAFFGMNFDAQKEIEKTGELMNKKLEQEGYLGYVVFNLRPWKKMNKILYKNIVQAIVDICEKNKLIPVFIPFQVYRQNDINILNKIIEHSGLKSDIKLRKYDDDIFNIVGIISGAKCSVMMRLHSSIFSLSVGVPFIALSYSEKIRALLKENNLMDTYIDICNVVIGYENYVYKAICEKIEEILNNQKHKTQPLLKISRQLSTNWHKSMQKLRKIL